MSLEKISEDNTTSRSTIPIASGRSKEYIYLIQKQVHILLKDNIYKVGRTATENYYFDRFNAAEYREGNLLMLTECIDSRSIETKIIKLFNERFGKPADGKEGFRGDLKIMRRIILQTIEESEITVVEDKVIEIPKQKPDLSLKDISESTADIEQIVSISNESSQIIILTGLEKFEIKQKHKKNRLKCSDYKDIFDKFIDKHCKYEEKGNVGMPEFILRFKEFCQDNKTIIPSDKMIGNLLIKEGITRDYSRRIYKGIEFK